MIYLHTSRTDPTAPLLMLHLPSITLASLALNAMPGEAHLLTIDAAAPPPDEVIAEFASTLETIAPGTSSWLSVVTRQGIAKDLPEFIHFTPAIPDPKIRFVTHSPRHHFTRYTSGDFVTNNPPFHPLIAAQADIADKEFIRTITPTSSPRPSAPSASPR